MNNHLLIDNARIWDGAADDYVTEGSILIVDGRIAEIGNVTANADRRIDMAGRAVLPGFIDAHFHAYASHVSVPHVEGLPLSYFAHHGACALRAALRRGFTTVRDAGGADWGLWKAVEDGLVVGSRVLYSGRAFSQTGGHGDSRPAYAEPCGCRHIGNLSEVVDGVEPLRRAARETLRRGAHQLKIFVSGGVSSPTDPIWMRQYCADEIRAVVEEARSRRTYVMAHAYAADAIVHAVDNGVRCIEHGNLLDTSAAEAMVKTGAFLDPTLVTYAALAKDGARYGLSPISQKKLIEVASRGAKAVQIARAAGVKIGFGTDLLGPLQSWQLQEFRLRGEVDSPLEVLRSATSVNAEMVNRTGELGVIAPGAIGDLVVFDGNPLQHLRDVYENGPWMVVKSGNVVFGGDA